LVLHDQRRFTPAIELFQQLIDEDHAVASSHTNLASIYLEQGRVDRAIEACRAAISSDQSAMVAHDTLLFALLCSDRYTPEEIFTEHLRWASQHGRTNAMTDPHLNDRSPDRQLRIGYISPDFRNHPIASFIEPILTHHDRTQFHAVCYNNGIPDDVTARLCELAADWRDVRGMPDTELIRAIRADEIDILIDLSAHSAGNRLPVFAAKPAPIEMTYLGYAATTGLSTIDYRITDSFLDPPGLTEHLHSEQLLRLPETFWCYQPPAGVPDPADHCRPPSEIMFGSLHRLAKIGDSVVATWAEILGQAPGAKLTLMAGGLADQPVRDDVAGRFQKRGIAPDQLILLGPQRYDQYMATMGNLDIALDPFPFAGGTTTCNALWMGVPVITLAGAAPISRVGVSVLTTIGAGDLIASTPDEYIRHALELSEDLPRRIELRRQLRAKLLNSPLLDGWRFVQHLEEAYRNAWQRWCI
jgi:predicted O-linked N-acetylglucosamine transferase (SPINDLY family)